MPQVDLNHIKLLLYRGESETLDFKSEQYKFEKASDEEKSELLKDVIAMANAWKSTDAYIIIGASEIPGERANVINIDNHLNDASVQEFVQSKTNRAVTFNYHVLTVDNCKLGVIKINKSQLRPITLGRDFGKLSKDKVYVRRGSSTGIASVDEIAQMGADEAQEKRVPNIYLEFSVKRNNIGHHLKLTSLCFSDELKNMYLTSESNVFNVYMEPRKRDVYNWVSEMITLNTFTFNIRNASTVLAENLVLTLQGNNCDDYKVTANYPYKPGINIIRNVVSPSVDYLEVFKDGWEICSNVGNIQPNCEIWHEVDVYFSALESCHFKVEAIISGDNIPAPTSTELKVKMDIYEMEDTEKGRLLLENWESIDEGDMLNFGQKLLLSPGDG